MPSVVIEGLKNRPRVWNALHALGLVKPVTQTTAEELACIGRHASGRGVAVEIGTFMGASAAVIALALGPSGRLYTVDPDRSPVARRHLGRRGVLDRVEFLTGLSTEVASRLPRPFDFIFIDGDHSWGGLEGDWQICRDGLAPGGIACLHDTSVPERSRGRDVGSVDYFEAEVRGAEGFEWVECVHSLNVMRRC